MCLMFFFFFSSRRRHTRCSRDWSSDVCSSDLFLCVEAGLRQAFRHHNASVCTSAWIGPETGCRDVGRSKRDPLLGGNAAPNRGRRRMRMNGHTSRVARLLVVMLFMGGPAWGQFTASIQGTVVDQSGAVVAQAKVDLLNTVTRVPATSTTDGSGNYRFLSLAPGSYKITVEAKGFSKSETSFTLETNQNLNLPISLKVGAATESVVVTTEPPLLNTAETRNQQTLQAQELSTLPLAGRNLLSLISVAPGVSGLGLAGGPGVASGTPGTGVDIFSTETAADVSANGQGTVANM